MPLTAPIEPGAISPVDGASLLGRARFDGPGAARSIFGAELAELVAAGAVRQRLFAVVGTFPYSPTSGTRFVAIEAVGAGGAGGASGAVAGAGAGGGSGGAYKAVCPVDALGTFPIDIVIGAGGVAVLNAAGGDGDDTQIGDVVTLTGAGGGGVSEAGVAIGGARGGGSSTLIAGELLIAGGEGQPGVLLSGSADIDVMTGGAGAASIFSAGGRNSVAIDALAPMDGGDATYGAGGGAGAAVGESTALGGNGGQAVVVIWEFGG